MMSRPHAGLCGAESQQVGTQSLTVHFSASAGVSLYLPRQGDMRGHHQSNCHDRQGPLSAAQMPVLRMSALHGSWPRPFSLSSAATQWAQLVWSRDGGTAAAGSEGSQLVSACPLLLVDCDGREREPSQGATLFTLRDCILSSILCQLLMGTLTDVS